MTFVVSSRVEQTTAATDAALAVLALSYSAQIATRPGWRARVWTAAFGALGLGAGLGAVAHGLQVGRRAQIGLWRGIYLSLGLTVALFGSAATADGWGLRAGRRALPWLLLAALGFVGLSQRLEQGFRAFIAFEAVTLLYALGVYGQLASGGRLAGAELTAGGILVSILAAAIQPSSLELEILGLPFDHNGLFHLVQIAGLPLLAAGVRAGLHQQRSIDA